MQSLAEILMLILNVALFLVLAHVIMSWLINFQVLNLRQPVVGQLWYGLNRILEPLYSQVRRVLPVTAGIDFAPLAVMLAIYILQIILRNNFYV